MYATELRNYEIIRCILPYFKNPNAVLACRSFLKNAPLKRGDDIDQALCLTLLNNCLEKNLDFVDAEEEFCTIS